MHALTMMIRNGLRSVKHALAKHTICKVAGHYSTGIMLWYICDRCITDFFNEAGPSRWVGDTKITRSR